MARHQQPREIAELKGAIKHDPQRYRNEVPAVEQPLGQAPAHMCQSAQKIWFEIESLSPVKVLKGADRLALEVLCNLLASYRSDPDEFPANKYTHIIGLLARLGMTPADRQKLTAEKKPVSNPFDEF